MHPRIETILNGIAKTKRIANAYLFTGPPGSGKLEAAMNFAKQNNNTEKDTGIDIVIVEKDKTSLKIDQIRQLKEITRYGPSQSPYLFVIIKDADAMTIEAANSFLKLMEEPPPNTVFILITEKEESLPSTIRSRCQKIIFPENRDFKADETSREFYNNILSLKNLSDLFKLSKSFDAEEGLLASLMFLFYQAVEQANSPIGKNIKSIRAIKEISEDIRRKASKRIAMDILLLRLGEIWNKN